MFSQALKGSIFRIVSEVAREQGVRAFVIGGYVRDYFLHTARLDHIDAEYTIRAWIARTPNSH